MVYRRTERVLDRLAQRRTAILTSAIELADREGLDELNVNHICKLAGVATGTVYLHFVNRDELVADIVAFCVQEDTAAMLAASRDERDPMAKLARALGAFMAIYTASRKLHPSLMVREGYRRAIVRTVTDIIAQGQASGMAGTDPEMLALAIVGALHTVLLSQTNPSRARLTALMEAVLRIADVTPQTYRARVKESA